VPVQLSETLFGLKVSGVSVMVKVPGKGAALGGVHVTDTVQLENAVREDPQVALLILKVGDPELILGAGLTLIETL
jgi:hypothetical protein